MTSTLDFLSTVIAWPDEGQQAYCNIHWSTMKVAERGARAGKPFWNGYPAVTPADAVNQVAFRFGHHDTRDLYVCMSTQSSRIEKVFNGRPVYEAVRSQENVVALRGFYLDIDVKPDAYATTPEAFKALLAFISEVGLPKPTFIVTSGSGGLHVHWTTNRKMTRAEWQPLASALAAAAIAKGLKCDTQCTIDSARILRIPGTLNKKSDPPKPVEAPFRGDVHDFEVIEKALAPFVGTLQVAAVPQQSTGPVSLSGIADTFGAATPSAVFAKPSTDELAAGLDQIEKAKQFVLEDVAKGCPFIARTLATGGADNNDPTRLMTAQVAVFTTGGLDDALRMTASRTTCTPEETANVYDRSARNHAEKNYGWPKCARIAALGTPECVNCPLLAQGKSPLAFAAKPEPAQTITTSQVTAPGKTGTDVLPSGFQRAPDGRIMKIAMDDGAQVLVPICDYPLMDGWLQDNPWSLHFTTITALGKRAKIDLPLETIATKDALTKRLGQQGVSLSDSMAKSIKEFFVAWVQTLQKSKDAVVSSTPFGWAIVNGKTDGFTYAGRVWQQGSDRPAAAPDHILNSLFTPKGEIEPWKEAAKIITDQRRPELNAIVAAAFAAPLMRFTGERGAMMNCYSTESGIGKSTSMKIAQAVWGNPVKAMQQLDDTQNSVLRRVGELKNLPLFWDELKTEAQATKFVTMAFSLTQGREKTRLNSDVTQRETGDWQTLLVSASNDSIIDPLQKATKSTTAGLYRCFEYVVTPGAKGQLTHGQVSRKVDALNEHYGQAGLIYAQFLGREHEAVSKEVAALHDMLTHEVNAGNDERFWMIVISVVMAGARYANMLGLTDIDEPGLKVHFLDVLGKMRAQVKDAPTDLKNQMSVSTILAQFLNDTRIRHTLFTNRINVSKGRPRKGAYEIVGSTDKLDGVWVQIGRDDRLMRVSSTQLSRWLADHGYGRHTFTQALKDEFGFKETNGILGSGTDRSTGAVEYLLEVDMNDKRLANFVE